MHSVNEANADVLGIADYRSALDDKGQGNEGIAENGGEEDSATKLYTWINLVNAVSELTRYDFDKVFGMPAMEFFTYVTYLKYKQKKEEQKLRQFRAQHKI